MGHLLGACAETFIHSFEGLEKGNRIIDNACANNARNGAHDGCHRCGNHAKAAAGRCKQHAIQAVIEEAHQPAWGIKKVEGLASWWRVDNNKIKAWIVVQLEQFLGCHVFLRSAERRGNIAKKSISDDAFNLCAVAAVALHQIGKGFVGIKHHRPQFATIFR